MHLHALAGTIGLCSAPVILGLLDGFKEEESSFSIPSLFDLEGAFFTGPPSLSLILSSFSLLHCLVLQN